MRCSSYCTAKNYDLPTLRQAFAKHYDTFRTDDALALVDETEKKYIFIFSYGCVVAWNFKQDDETKFLKKISAYSVKRSKINSHEEFEAKIGTTQRVKNDLITLDGTQDIPFQMLTVSYALSQSAILSLFEERIWNTIEHTKHLPQELAEKGRTSMSRKNLTKQLGLLFKERHSVNLHTDILDTPDFFWDNPEYEHLYRLARSDLSTENRTAVLNTRLEIVHELLVMIREELTSRHSSFLEWIIILLIAIEVGLSLLIHVFKAL